MLTITCTTISWSDLKNTTQWSLLELPRNINTNAMIMTHIVDKLKMPIAYWKKLEVLSFTIYFGIFELIDFESFLSYVSLLFWRHVIKLNDFLNDMTSLSNSRFEDISRGLLNNKLIVIESFLKLSTFQVKFKFDLLNPNSICLLSWGYT